MATSYGKALTASVRIDNKQALRALNELDRRINAINTATNKNVTANNKLNTAINKAVNTANRLNTANIKAANSAQKINKNYKQAGTAVSSLTNKVKALASAYLGVMGARALLTTSDTITSAENKLNNLDGGSREATAVSMDKMYSASQRSRTGYADMMGNVSKAMTLAGGAFGNNIDNAIRFQEIMSKAYTVGGASQAEQASSMYQMIQALGSGILQGDELRSIREGAPIAYKEIEKFAQKLYETDESLKDLASDGKITSDIVVAAIMDAGDAIDAKFENTSMTFAQAFTNMKNVAIRSFQPVLQMLNQALNSKVGQTIINGIGVAIQYVAGIVQVLFNLIGEVYNFVVSNWSTIVKILLTIATIKAATLIPQLISEIKYIAFAIYYYSYLGTQAVASALKTAGAWLIANWQMLLIIAVIVAIIVALIWLSDSFSDACGIIVGYVMASVSAIWNAFVTLVTFIIKNTVLPLVSAWDMFANFFGNILNDPISTIIYNFEIMAQTVLNLLETIANGIDAIFGSNLASIVSGWADSLSSKADELANKYGNGTYEVKSDKTEQVNDLLNDVQTNLLWDTSDAYNTGYDWGVTGANWLTDKLSEAGDWISDKLNVGSLTDTGLDTTDDLFKSVNNIDDNTSAISDSMELTSEDLEYLRKVAEMEWTKEFTTATINVDMSNYNTVNGESDLDGIVTKLSEKLYEELQSVADGVYV